MEYSSRVFAKGLESQEFTYPDEYTRRQGLHNFYRISYITLERKKSSKPFFFLSLTTYSTFFIFLPENNYILKLLSK